MGAWVKNQGEGKYTCSAGALQEVFLWHASGLPLRVHAPNNWVLGIWVIVTVVQVLRKYTIIGYLDLLIPKP